MNQLQKFQREFLGEDYGAKDRLERHTLQQPNKNQSSITEEEDEETASDHNLAARRAGIDAEDVSFNVDSPHWSAKTKARHARDSSQKNFTQLDSEEKQVRWTGRTNLSQSHAAIFVQFCERLAIRDALCGVHDYLQQLESIFLTMCCKENPDMYNSLIVDLQGFVDVKKSSHFEVLAVVRIQSERITEIVGRYVASKYNMSKFAELMYSIMSPAQMQSIGSDQNNQARTQKSFSFEVSSGGVRKYQSSGEGKYIPKSQQFQPDKVQTSGGKTNPFILEQISSPSKICDVESQSDSQNSTPSEDGELFQKQSQILQPERELNYSQPGESPRSPLNFQEVQLCNEMIDRLKAECQEYELTIVDQHKEISDLKQVIENLQGSNKKGSKRTANQIDDLEGQSLVRRLKNEIQQLTEQNEQKSIHLANGGDLITGLQQQIKELKAKLNQEEGTKLSKKEGETLQLTRNLQALRTENEQLKQRFHDMQYLCREKEQKMAQIEIQAHNTLVNAQKDAEDCIQYFKQLALANSTKPHEVLEPILITTEISKLVNPAHLLLNRRHLRSGALVPQTLAPLKNSSANGVQTEREHLQNRPHERTKEANHLSFLNMKNQFIDLTKDEFESTDSANLKLQIVLSALSKAFEEVNQLKSGVISQVTQYRDLYVDQIKQFSVLTYDYLERIEAHVLSHEQYHVEIDNYNRTVEELKQVSLQQTKHIRAQNELVLAQKEKIVYLTDFMEKQLRRKERDRQNTFKFMSSELPMLSQTLTQTMQQVGDLQNSDYMSKNSVQELLQGHDLAKKKIEILEEELEKSLQANEDFSLCIQQGKEKYERLTELIQDVWLAEVQTLQPPTSASRHQFTFDRRAEFNGSDGVGSVGSLVSSEAVPMPVNWLSEIREKIRQLREINDCQKDECYQMLNLLNASVNNETEQLAQTDTDGHTLQQTIDDDDDDSSRGIGDLGSEMCNSDSHGRHQQVAQIDSQRQKAAMNSQMRYNLSSPTENSKTKSGKSNRKILIQHMTEKHEFNEKPIRSISADNQRGPTSQRTPKNVSFSHNVLNSSIPSSDPAKKILVPRLAQNGQQRNELHQMLREEIYRLKSDFSVSRETIIHMKADIKALRRQNSEQKALAEQAQFELHNQNSNQGQLLQDFEEAQTHIEDLEENLKQREQTISNLRQELQNFETEFSDLQRQLKNVVTLNNEISQQCEHWELCHQAAQQELAHVRQLHDQKIQKIQEGHEEKLRLQKKKLQEKELLIQDTLVMLEREKEFRQAIETKRQNVSDSFTETQPYIQSVETENESLRTQLHQVKQDITAVLEQYDREHASNKQLKKKLDQAKNAHKQLIDELNQARKEMDLIGQQLNQMQSENDELQIAIQHQQHQYQHEIQQEHHVNEQLQAQVEQVTQLTEDLQHQIIGSTNDNGDLSRRVVIQEETIRQLESKIRESLADRNEDMKKIQKLREKLLTQKRQRGHSHNSHHAHSQLVGQDKRLIVEKPLISQNSHSSSQSDFGTQARHITHKLRLEVDERNHALDETEVTSNRYKRIDRQSQKAMSNERPYSEIQTQNNSVCTSNINYSLPPQNNRHRPNKNIAITQNNPFNNLSNLSGVFDSQRGTLDNRVPSVSCCCGNKACFGSQNNISRQPSFHQPSNDTGGNLQLYELKWRAEVKEASRKKVQSVQKHIEDLLKHFCRQIVEKQQPNQLVTSSSQNLNLQKHVKEWSADVLLDCWNTEEADLIGAKAYFNKYSPIVLTCLKLLVDNNIKNYQEDMLRLNNAPPTLASSRFQNPLSEREQDRSKITYPSSQEKNISDQQELVEAYQQLAQHCQQLLQRYLQVGRSLAGICFGGCLLVGSGFNQQTKDQVDFAMKFLAQDTTLIESTSNDTMQEILTVVDNLLNCLQQIIKSSCQAIISRSSLSKSEANRMLESVQQSCEYSVGPKTTTNNHSLSQSNSKMVSAPAHNQQTFALNSQENFQANNSVRDKLIEVENRIKQKFQHVSKLETSLDQLLSRQNESQSQGFETSQDHSSSNTSMLTDTKTVMKLLTTVKRVVSKLKIELHQDYLQLGNINVGMLHTPSQASSHSLSHTQNTFEAQMLSGINTPTLQPQKFSAAHNSGLQTDRESKESLKPENQMVGRIIEEMQGLTFEKENRPSRRTIKSHQV